MSKLVLHIGQMKSGTTYIQNILQSSRSYLNENSWIYPGKKINQQHEVYGICGKDVFWVRESMRRQNQVIADKLVEEIKSKRNSHNLIISAEALSSLSASGIARFIDNVGKPDEVVLTVRSLYKVLPSAWQQSLKGGHDRSLEEFFELLKKQRPNREGFWKTYSFGEIVKKWASFAPVKVIVVPDKPAKKDQLWNMFSKVVGLPEEVCREPDESKSNISLNMESASFLRALIRAVSSDGELAPYKTRIIGLYLNGMVFPLAPLGRGNKIFPLESFKEDLDKWGREEVELLEEFSTDIVGDVGSLTHYSGEFQVKEVDDACDSKNIVCEEVAYQLARNLFYRLQ